MNSGTHHATSVDLDFSVVICAYTEDRWDDLCAAVESVRRQTFPAREIIIVVDHNPTLLERVRSHMQGVTAIENQGLPGASSARNSGVDIARSPVIAFLDDDAVAEPNWLKWLAMGYADPKVLGVGGTLAPVWVGGCPSWFPSEFNWVVGCTYTGLPEEIAPIRNLIAANMSVRRDVFDTLGGFRNGYGNIKVDAPSRPFWIRSCAGDEETEFCIRANRWWPNRTWLYMPSARVHHLVPIARSRWIYFFRRCYDEGIGKALLSRIVGASRGLATEGAYTLKTLPRGILRGLRDTIRGDVHGFARACAIAGGLMITTTGYAVGTVYALIANNDNVARQGSEIDGEAKKQTGSKPLS